MPHGPNQIFIYDKFWPWTTFPKHLDGSTKIPGGTVYLLVKSYNDIINKVQMDIVVRSMCNNRVVSQYLTSNFLGHTTAEDLKENILSAIQPIDESTLVQISMDGPNSNWSLYSKIRDQRKK